MQKINGVATENPRQHKNQIEFVMENHTYKTNKRNARDHCENGNGGHEHGINTLKSTLIGFEIQRVSRLLNYRPFLSNTYGQFLLRCRRCRRCNAITKSVINLLSSFLLCLFVLFFSFLIATISTWHHKSHRKPASTKYATLMDAKAKHGNNSDAEKLMCVFILSRRLVYV